MSQKLRGRLDRLAKRVDAVAGRRSDPVETPAVVFHLPCKTDEYTGVLLERPRQSGPIRFYDPRPPAVLAWIAEHPGEEVPHELWLDGAPTGQPAISRT